MFKANINNSSQQELQSGCFCDHVSPNINKLWLLPARPFSTCVTPGISHNTHPEGESCITMYKCVFLPHRHFFLFRPRVFSRVLGSVARREPVRTPRASLGPGRGPQHVLWGLEVASPGEGFRARRDMHVHANPRTG